MRIVIETNVLISGIVWRGVPGMIVDAIANKKFRLVISSEIHDEYSVTLKDFKKNVTTYNIEESLKALEEEAVWISGFTLPNQICTDRDDDKFIAAAVAGHANAIVSGDKALLKVKVYQGIEIFTARQFVTRFLP